MKKKTDKESNGGVVIEYLNTRKVGVRVRRLRGITPAGFIPFNDDNFVTLLGYSLRAKFSFTN
jgi:hypothetical protein